MAHETRIISLLPGATEIVAGLGLYDSLVGVSHACDDPADVADLPRVTQPLVPGGDASSAEIDAAVKARVADRQPLYKLDIDKVKALKPTHIVTQGLCNVCAVAESDVQAAISALGSDVEVIALEPRTLTDVLGDIIKVGEALGATRAARHWESELRFRVETVALNTAGHIAVGAARVPTVVLEWLDPPFSCGHWTPELIDLAGGRPMIGQPGQPSRQLDWQEVRDAGPEVLVLACCGFGIERTVDEIQVLTDQLGWHELPAVRNSRVFVVDGDAYFNRPGPRLVDSLEILAHALWPEAHELPAGLERARRVKVS